MTFGYTTISIFLGILLIVKVVQSIMYTFTKGKKESQYDDIMYALASAGGHLFSTVLGVFFYIFQGGTEAFLRVVRITLYIQFSISVILMLLFLTLTFSVLIADYRERTDNKKCYK